MASENVENWDLPLPIPEYIIENTDDELTQDEVPKKKNIDLKNYVQSMAYNTVEPIKDSPRTASLSKPGKRYLLDNAKQFSEFMVPREKAERVKRLAAEHNTITVEQLEKVIRSAKTKELHKEDILKRKEEICYELLTKVEQQCRTQYLNHIFTKFSDFIAKLSTTMRIPPTLFDPHARMQRALFCKILHTIGVEPTSHAAIYYNTKEGTQYAVCHKLSHALVIIIIKALDLSSTRNPDYECPQLKHDFKMDNIIKNRLMRAAKKKLLSTKY